MKNTGHKTNLGSLLGVLTILVMLLIVTNTISAQTPEFLWAKQAGGSSNDYARSIATDWSGNSFITGDFQGSVNFGVINLTSVGGSDIFVAKYDASGNILWARRAGGTSSDYGRYIETDGSGNAIVTGQFYGSAIFGSITLTSNGSSDIFVVKYDASGNVLWAKRAGGTGGDSGYGIDAEWEGNCIVTGSFNGTATFDSFTLTSAGLDDIFIAKYDASGNVLWARRAGGTTYDFGLGIIIVESGNSIITGRFNGSATFGSITLTSAGGSDIFIAKYAASGNVLWAKQAGGTGNDYGYNVTMDGSYNGIITGSFHGSATFGFITLTSAGSEDVFIAKYNTSGDVLWAKQAGGIGSDRGLAIETDGSGNSFVAGEFSGSANFDGITLTSAGNSDIFIAKYDASGNIQWATSAGGTNLDIAYNIATDGANNSIMTGFFTGTATFGSINLTSAGLSDVFIVKLTETPSWITVTYPNGGEVWYVGNSGTITWITDNYTGLVEIALSKDGGNNWINLTDPSYAPNTGSYDYTPQPEHVSNNCLIQITSSENATVKDQSNGVFSIVNNYIPNQYVAMRLPTGVPAPTIDGVLNELFWSRVDEDSLLFGGVPESWNTPWLYPGDNLVCWKAVWSEVTNKLYVAIIISDDIRGIFDHNNPNDISFAPYLDECLEIFTDGDHSGGFYEDTYDNAQQWMVTGENKIVLDDYPSSTKLSIYNGDGLKTAVSWGINGNWICEAEFKIYDTFPTIRKNLKIDDIIGWNIWYDDSDNETLENGRYVRDHQVGWLYTGKANNDANYFGDLVLGGDLGWSVPIAINAGSTQLIRIFGGDANATDGYDPGLDVPAAPPGMSYYAYFELAVFPYYLETDIRKWVAPYTAEISWTLKIVNATGITSTLTWNPAHLPATASGTFMLTGAGAPVNMRSQSSATVTGSVNLIIKYYYGVAVYNFPQQGWYLISLPVTPPNNSLSVLFPTAIAAYAYNPATGNYYPVTSLETKKGYWLLIPAATNVTISGTPLTTYTAHYTTGWHLIGTVLGNTNFTDPKDNPNGSVIAVYGYNSTTGQYYQVYPPGTGLLKEKEGYWLAVMQSCDLTIGGTIMSEAPITATDNIEMFKQRFGHQPPAPPFVADKAVAQLLPNSQKIVSHNYPNPFNPETVIEYSLPKDGLTQVYIYNALGQRIRTLYDDQQQAGVHQVVWDGRNDRGELMSNGLYFYKIINVELVEIQKILFLK